MSRSVLIEHIKKQLLADTALITRTQNHDFVALMTQQRAVSARFAQQMEKMAVEGLNLRKEFDPMATSFMLQKDRNNQNQVLVNELFLKMMMSR